MITLYDAKTTTIFSPWQVIQWGQPIFVGKWQNLSFYDRFCHLRHKFVVPTVIGILQINYYLFEIKKNAIPKSKFYFNLSMPLSIYLRFAKGIVGSRRMGGTPLFLQARYVQGPYMWIMRKNCIQQHADKEENEVLFCTYVYVTLCILFVSILLNFFRIAMIHILQILCFVIKQTCILNNFFFIFSDNNALFI